MKTTDYKIPFGKYRGRMLSTLTTPEETKYLHWLMNTDNNVINRTLIDKHLRGSLT